MKLYELLTQGYQFGEQKKQRGYTSRKNEDDNVYTARGRRKGQYYVLLPSYESTKYCIRQYLYKEGV